MEGLEQWRQGDYEVGEPDPASPFPSASTADTKQGQARIPRRGSGSGRRCRRSIRDPGRARDRLRFELGVRPDGPPLGVYASGDRVLRISSPSP